MFGYDDHISELLPPQGGGGGSSPSPSVVEIKTHDVAGCLQYLSECLLGEGGEGKDGATISNNGNSVNEMKGDKKASKKKKNSKRRQPSKGRLTAQKLCEAIAFLQPEGAIIVDESLTSGTAYWNASSTLPTPFTHLTLTGGAIGIGPPLSLGVAIACPGRRVINFQADGSGMYTLQALWSQAREKSKVLSIICRNGTYNILKIEQSKQKLKLSGVTAKASTELSSPQIDWVSLANGMGVPAKAVDTTSQLLEAMQQVARKYRVLINSANAIARYLMFCHAFNFCQ
eukprot:jgi/Bigna1/138601/aug1.45_g13309